MGKGSAPRPFSVTNDEYANRWDAIFGRDQPKEEKPETKPEQEKKDENIPMAGE